MNCPIARTCKMILLTLLLTSFVGTTHAANYTWTGSGTTNAWFTSAVPPTLNSNWGAGAGNTLTSADNVTFVFGARTTANQGSGNTGSPVNASVNALTFAGSTSGTIGGTALLTLNGNLTNSSGVLQTISGGTLAFAANSTVDTGAGGITINRRISGSGDITKDGSGALTVSSGTGYTGTITVNSGSYGQSGSIGGSVVNAGANVNLGGNVVNFTQTSGTSTLNGTQSGSSTFTGGSTDLSGATFNGTVTFDSTDVSNGTNAAFNNAVEIKSGTVTLNANFTNQTLTVSGGQNALSANISTIVVTGGTTDILNNTVSGSLSQSGGVLNNVSQVDGGAVTTGGVLTLANNALITGGLTLGGSTSIVSGVFANPSADSLTLSNGGDLVMDFNSTGDAQLFNVTTNMVWGGNLTLNLTTSGSADDDTQWNFFDFAGKTGDLSGITLQTVGGSPYSGLTFVSATSSSFSYTDYKYGPGVWVSSWTGDGQRFVFNTADGVLTVVPEPSTIVFAGIGAAMLGWHTWTRSRRQARMKLIEEHFRKVSEERSIA